MDCARFINGIWSIWKLNAMIENGNCMKKDFRILVLGAGGLIGSRIVNQLTRSGYHRVIACDHRQLELTNQRAVHEYFMKEKPDYLYFCAVKSITDFDNTTVGDADELYSNSMMVCNTIQAALESGVKKAIFLGSAMLYPWNLDPCPDRLSEDLLDRFNISGYSPAMQSAVLSKLFEYKMCQFYKKQYGCNFIYCLPAHIYGGFSGRKNLYFTERVVMDICDAKLSNAPSLYLDVFGKGEACKNLLHVDDCAGAIIYTMNHYESDDVAINIVSDEIVTWSQLVKYVCEIVGYEGTITFNTERKENMSNRLCSTKKLNSLGFKPEISIYEGLKMLCSEYLQMKGEVS